MQSKNKTLTSICSQMDLFAQQVQLRINKSPKFYTPLGLCMSLILIALSLALAINNIIDVVNKSSPSVVSSEQQNTETPNFLFLPNNFTFVVSINKLTLENVYGLNTLYTLQFTSCFRKRDPVTKQITQECVTYSMNNCEDRNFEADYQKLYFEQFNKSNIYCINYDQWMEKPFSIKGAAASNEFKYVKFDLMICKNSTSNQTCLSEDEIKKTLPGGLIVYYVQDQLVDLKQSDSIFIPAIRQGSSLFAFDHQKTIVGYQKTVYVQTDVGLFVQDLQETSTYQSYLEKESSDALGTKIFMEYVFQLDPRQIYYNRSYAKIQDIIGTIGGLWQALFFLISILIMPFIESLLELSLINKFFTFSYKTIAFHDNDSISLNRSKSYLVSPPQTKTSLRKQITAQKPQIDKISSTRQIAQYLKERKSLLKISLSDLQNRKNNLNIAKTKFNKNQILQQLSSILQFILNRLFEIDKLKMVLLNERQLKLFNYFPKPCVSDALFSKDKLFLNQEEQVEFSYLLTEELTQEQKVQEAFKAYKELKLCKVQDPLDKRILNYFDLDLKNLFDALVDNEVSADSCIELPSAVQNDQQNDSNYKNVFSTYKTHIKPQIAQDE